MNALVYIIVRTFVNKIKEIIRKPAQLIVTVLLIAVIAGLAVMSLFMRGMENKDFADLVWLKLIIFALLTMFVGMGVSKGLKRGDMIFNMQDVNLLFVSPIDSRHILLYGVVQMAKNSLLMGFFILFQSNSICSNFDVGYSAVLLLFGGFILTVLLMQVVSLVIYSLTNSKPRLKLFVRLAALAVFIPLLGVIAAEYLASFNIVSALEAAFNSPVLSYTPIAGWATAGIMAFIEGNIGTGFMFFGLMGLAALALIVYIYRSNPDYYEDVLVATETAFEKKRAIAEGKINMESISGRRVPVAKTGVKGAGAAVFFSKHLRESFRGSRIGFFDTPTLIKMVAALGLSFFLGRSADLDGVNKAMIVLQSLFWAQMFLIGTARGMKEMFSHYVFLMPEPSFSKILWSNAETLLKVGIEGFVIFIAGGFLLNGHIGLSVLSVFIYIGYNLILIGINYLSMRFTGVTVNNGLGIIIYMLAVIITLAPGIAAGIFIFAALPGFGGVSAGFAAMALWTYIAGCLMIFVSRGILHSCDMPDITQIVKQK